MAINYLNTVDLNKNQLNNAAIQNLGTDPATGVLGQVYYNTTDSVLKICVTASTVTPTNAVWAEVGGGVETLTTTDGTYIDLTPNTPVAGAVTVTADLSAVDGTAVAATRFLSKDNTWDVPAFDNYSGWTLDGDSGTGEVISSGDTATFAGGLKITTDVASTDTLNIVHDLQSQTNSTSAASPAAGATFTVIDSVTVDTTGHIGGKNLKTITLPADTNTQETYTLPVSVGTAVTGYSVADIDLTAAGTSTGIKSKVTFAGKNSNIAITETALNNGVVKIALTNNVTIDNNLTVVGEISQTSTGNENTFASELNMSSLNIINLLDPTSPQHAATKQYVDDATLGGLIYQGGYNSSTNVPVLDSRGTQIAVEKGWTYTVTADGTFYGEVVRAGDVLIAEVDLASGAGALTDWTTVQNNIDLASDAQVGIGNVKKSTVATLDGISVAYSSGTASVGLDIEGLTYITQALTSSDLAGIEIPIYNGDIATAANQKIEVQDLIPILNPTISKTGSIAVSQTSGTVTHDFGQNTLVQTFDAGSGATVFCDVVRDTTTPYDVTATISTTQATAITILVQKIG